MSWVFPLPSQINSPFFPSFKKFVDVVLEIWISFVGFVTFHTFYLLQNLDFSFTVQNSLKFFVKNVSVVFLRIFVKLDVIFRIPQPGDNCFCEMEDTEEQQEDILMHEAQSQDVTHGEGTEAEEA